MQLLGGLGLVTPALVCLAAAGVATGIAVSAPFAHDDWLIAYLALVGFLAQLLLGSGQAMLLGAWTGSRPPHRARLAAQASLWNFGVVAVPLGVLTATRLFVVIGGLGLIAALGSLWASVRLALDSADPSWLGWAYVSLLVAMLSSVLIGTGLAWDLPWT